MSFPASHKRRSLLLLVLLCGGLLLVPLNRGLAQNVREFGPLTDSLSTLVKGRTSVNVKLSLRQIRKRGQELDFYFNDNLSDIPWKKNDESWLRSRIKELLPKDYKNLSVGRIYCRTTLFDEFFTPEITRDGRPATSPFRKADPKGSYIPLVRRLGDQEFSKGLSSRHIALWQSHGRYYEEKTRRWEWQRAQTWLTVEDMYTQSYVLPFLIPMLENAGAYVMTPRERDTQPYECVVDNDRAFAGERTGLTRREGRYSESGEWRDAGIGFADKKEVYIENDNPFTMGTVRMATVNDGSATARARYQGDIPKRGKYAVYVSYKTFLNSTTCANYTVHHLGGTTSFSVNQRMGGGTWIYLGTFEFEEGRDAIVEVDNSVPRGGDFARGRVVTTDAVRFGGGMGKIARGNTDTPTEEWETSGVAAYMEGALYNMQWAGIDTTITRAHETDYTNDYADRGPWVGKLSGGSFMNPKEQGKGIPFDLSLGFHTDAGTTPNDSIVGTLSIYTLLADGSRELPDGTDRNICRELAELVQTQIVDDIRSSFEPAWSRRQIWNRSYSESRTPSVPAMLLELLSHQNFADMKYGLDPTFRFTVSRSVYKGMLKFLSNRYGFSYEVQPLPVRSMAARLGDGSATLSWKPTPDELEPTAVPTGYIVYTRVDDGAFDDGVVIGEGTRNGDRVETEVQIEKGHIYSYKVVAYNDGGRSFPSEVLCVANPGSPKGKVLVVNNFDRVSPGTWFDYPDYGGFDERLDGGVAWGYEINYIGRQYQFRRELPWVDDDNPGFGGSYTDMAGKKIPGNTFDFVYSHAKLFLENGLSVESCSSLALQDGLDATDDKVLDLLCGKQVTTTVGPGGKVPDRYTVFPSALQKALRTYANGGGNILVSGANIGTDAWDKVYPNITVDPASRAATQGFIQGVLGYKWITNYATKEASVRRIKTGMMDTEKITGKVPFHSTYNEDIYFVETPDGILPANDNADTFLRYSDTNISAGVCFDSGKHRAVSLGFPLEVVKSEKDREMLVSSILAFFEKERTTKKR